MSFVSKGKCSAKAICNGKYEEYEGVIFIVLALSIFSTS
jgi:hypothetical protein